MDFTQQLLIHQHALAMQQQMQMQMQQHAMMTGGFQTPAIVSLPSVAAAAPNNQHVFFPSTPAPAPAPQSSAASAASTPPAHAAAASYPAAAASSSSAPPAAARRSAASKSARRDGPRELQVVWQGEWKASQPAPMELDDERASPPASSDSRMQSRELRLTASSLAELRRLVHAHFPTRPDRPLQLTDDKQRVLTSEADFASLEAGDVVLGFDSSDRRITFTWSKSFQHIPHPSIVTYSQELIAAESSGEAHTIVAYALAEFVDNSISALRKYRADHAGEIRISFMEHRHAVGGRKQWSIAIADDGCGMDSDTIHAFSRMGDAPQYRNEVRGNTLEDARNHFLNINISQWGVGAKSAGFFLGNCITVTSRQEQLAQVLQCAMSQQKMFDDHQESGNAFNDQLVHRAIGDLRACKQSFPSGAPMHTYLEHLVRHEPAQAHFTRIIVTGVEQRHLAKLADVRLIARELARVYNRFLHGPMGLNCGPANANKVWLRPRLVVEHCVEVEGAASGAPSWRRTYEQDLGEERDNETAVFQMRRQGPTLRFKMLIDAPLADTHSAEQGHSKERAVVMGELFYLPKGVDGETHPRLQRKEAHEADDDDPVGSRPAHKRARVAGVNAMAALAPTAGAVTAAAASAAAAAVPLPLDSDGNVIPPSEENPVFDVYWHGRLIPFARVDLLPFMKFKPEFRDCLARMHGALFFSFPFLTSRNKLAMAERDLQGFLHKQLSEVGAHVVEPLDDNGDQPVGTSSRNKNIANRWKDVLETQWKPLDANYIWDPVHRLPAESAKEGKELYSQVSLTGSSKPMRAGELYKIWNAAAKTSKPIWLRAKYFEKETTTGVGGGVALVAGANVGSVGKIWGDVMPLETQQAPVVKSLRLIDKVTPPEQQQEEYADHVAAAKALVPHKIEVWMEPRDLLPPGTTRIHKSADYCFPAVAVAVWGHPHRGVAKPLTGEKVVCRAVRFDDEPEGGAGDAIHAQQSRVRLDSDSDDEKQSSSSVVSSRNRTARPKQLRRAGGGSAAAPTDSGDAGALSSDDDGKRERPGQSTRFFYDTNCMTKEVALAVRHGANVQGSGGSSSDASAAAAEAGKKRKDRHGHVLGVNGFSAYEFDKHKCGHYRISFFLGGWTTVDQRYLSRKNVPRVHVDILLTPALPVQVTLDRSCMDAARIHMRLGQTLEDAQPPLGRERQFVGFTLEDLWSNAWNHITLRGQTSLCGIRVASISAVLAEAAHESDSSPPVQLLTSFKPELVWRGDQQKHWGIEQLMLSLPDGASLPFVNAASRIDVQLCVKFDVQTDYVFDPPPSADDLKKLRQVESRFTVRLGPGEATHFVCNEAPPLVLLTNGDSHTGLVVHLEDAWHHPTTAADSMQMQLATSVPFVDDSQLYTFDSTGHIHFDPVRVDIPPDVFAAHCQSNADGALVVTFTLCINLVFKDAPPGEVHEVNRMEVVVKPRWGPVRLLLLRGDRHLRHLEHKLSEEELRPLTLEGQAGDDVDGVYVAFLRETGQLLPVDEVKSFLGHRAPQLHFYLDGLDGAANHFTLRDLDSTGRIQQRDPTGRLPPTPGLSFSKLLVASRAEANQPVAPDGSLLFRGNFHLKIIDDSPPDPGAHDDDMDGDVTLDAERSAAALSSKAEKRAKLEHLPKLRDLLHFDSLSTPLFLRIRPGSAVRWSVTANFPRGFKCGLIWQDHVRVSLVDRYGNQAVAPSTPPPSDAKTTSQLVPHIDVHTRSPADYEPMAESPVATATAAAAATPAVANSASAPTSMDVDSGAIGIQDASVSASSSAEPGAAAAVPVAPAVTAAVAGAATSPASSAAAPASTSTMLPASSLRNFNLSRPQLADGSVAPYWTWPQAFMVASVGVYWLVARDASGVYGPSEALQIQLVAGVAQRIRAFTDPECTAEVGYSSGEPALRATSAGLNVQSKCKIHRIWCKFFDRGNNETAQPSNQIVEMQLVCPPRGANGGAAKGEEGGASAAAGSSAAISSAASSSSSLSHSSSDPTISGLYDYPLRRLPIHPHSEPSVKDEYTPLTGLIGVSKRPASLDPSSSASSSSTPLSLPNLVLLQEFTLHLNAADWSGSSLMIQSRDAQPKSTQKSKSAIKHSVLIPLHVQPFRQQVAQVQLQPLFPTDAMQAALHAAPDQLSLQSHLLAPPVAVPSAAAAMSIPAILPPVPAGTPFPTIYVDLSLDSGSGSVASLRASTGDAQSGDVVKLEPGMADEEVYHAGFMLPGLSIEVVLNPDNAATRRKQGDVYQPARFDPVRKKFFFAPMQVAELASMSGSLAPRPEDYVFDQTGPWLFLVRYLETRESVANVLASRDLERVAQLLQPVIAGQPRSLRLVPGCVDTAIVVGNVADAPPRTRTVASQLALELVDAFGHKVEFGSLAPEAMPLLQQLQWKLEPATRMPSAAAAPVISGLDRPAAVSSSSSQPSQQQQPQAMVIDLIDSDTEEEKSGAPASSPRTSGSATSSAPSAVAPSPASSSLAPPQLHIDPPHVNLATSRVEFGAITVLPATPGDSGRYTLTLSLPAPFGVHYRAAVMFQFTNDMLELQHHQEAARRRKAQLQVADAKYVAKLQLLIETQRESRQLDEQHAQLQTRQNRLTEQLARICRDLQGNDQIQVPIAARRSIDSLLQHLDDLQRELTPLAQPPARSDGIPVKLPPILRAAGSPMARLSKAQGFHGALVQLAFVSDFRLAALISWHMQSHLATLITSDRQSAADREVRQWCSAQRTGSVIDLRGVAPISFDAAVLPHQKSRDPHPPQLRGNPRYLLNCLHLHTTEALERTQYTNLLASLVGTTLIMDSMDDAAAYRHYCLQHRVRPPAILCLKELKLLSANNVERFDDAATARGLQYLATHFEVRPPSDIHGSSARAQAQLQAVSAALKQTQSLQADQTAIDAAIVQLNHPSRSHQLSVRVTDLQRESGALAAEVRRLGGSASDRLVAEAAAGISGAAPTAAAAIGMGQGAGGASAQSRLSQQHGQHEQDRRRAQTAQLLAMQQEGDRRTAAAVGAHAAPPARPPSGGPSDASRFFPSATSARTR